tara:strand:+ start:1447 stop:1953 length:507 start_codon:yes stop_codon:yes gene_type:complete
MALQSSGAISLNDIHVEAGGSSGTQASLNDADIRGLINKGSGVQMSFSEWYGASGVTTESKFEYTPSFTLYSANTFFFASQENSQIIWEGTHVVNNNNASYNFNNPAYFGGYPNFPLSNSLPFPAHAGTIGGWRYFGKRGDHGVPFGDEFVGGIDWPANRTTGSSYPF